MFIFNYIMCVYIYIFLNLQTKRLTTTTTMEYNKKVLSRIGCEYIISIFYTQTAHCVWVCAANVYTLCGENPVGYSNNNNNIKQTRTIRVHSVGRQCDFRWTRAILLLWSAATVYCDTKEFNNVYTMSMIIYYMYP